MELSMENARHYLLALKESGNFTIESIANISGVPAGTVQNFFSGKTFKNVGFSTVVKICLSIGGDLNELIGKEKTKEIEVNSIVSLKETHEMRLNDVIASYETRIADLKELCELRIADVHKCCELRIADARRNFDERLAELKANYKGV